MEHPAAIITAFQLLATPVLAKVVDVKCLNRRCGKQATLGAVIVPPFWAIATLGFTQRVNALTCTVTAAVVFRTWIGTCTNNQLSKTLRAGSNSQETQLTLAKSKIVDVKCNHCSLLRNRHHVCTHVWRQRGRVQHR